MKSLTDIEVKILLAIGFTLAAGIILLTTGHPIGIFIAGLAVLAIAGGWKKFSPSEPFQVGAVTIWNNYLKTGHEAQEPGGEDTRETVSVRGYCILMPYPPFFIDAVTIDKTAQEWTYDVIINSVENPDDDGTQRAVPVKGQIKLTVEADECHANSFAQSGSDLKKIKELLGGIPYRKVQQLVKTMIGGDNENPGLSYIEMVQQGDLISMALEAELNGFNDHVGVFEQKSFGIVCKKVQVIFEVPEDIRNAMIAAAKVAYEVSARTQENEGDVQAAKRFDEELHVGSTKAWEMAVISRLLRDGKITRKQFEGLGNSVGAVLLEDTDSGSDQKGGKKNK